MVINDSLFICKNVLRARYSHRAAVQEIPKIMVEDVGVIKMIFFYSFARVRRVNESFDVFEAVFLEYGRRQGHGY